MKQGEIPSNWDLSVQSICPHTKSPRTSKTRSDSGARRFGIAYSFHSTFLRYEEGVPFITMLSSYTYEKQSMILFEILYSGVLRRTPSLQHELNPPT